MSANNWRVCPKCKATRGAELAAESEELAKQYGKIKLAEFNRLTNELHDKYKDDLEESLREDYGLRITEDGTFYVSYRGHCGTCGFTHTFKHEDKVI
jgi:ribosome-binding protein aMBF1 (putative translation factor)